MRRLLLITALLVVPALATAQVTVRAVLDPPQIAVGQTSDLQVVVQNARTTGTPTIANVAGATVQYAGPETNVAITNGQVTQSVTHHFTVTPQHEGTITLGPITVPHEGGTVSAGAVTLRVAAGEATPDDDQLGLTMSVPRTRVWLHERLPVTVLLRVGAVRVGEVQYPEIPADGVAFEALAEPSQRQEQGAGGAAQIVEFRTALTPLRAGPVTIGPATLKLSMLTQRAGRRSIFQPGMSRQPMQLTSEPIELDVQPLPDAGRPADFSGAVGRFSLDVRATPLELTQGDPVTLTITLRGEGNLASATPPALPASDALRVYPPQPANAQNNAASSGDGLIRVYEQVVIPQASGAVTLPALRFSYFDSESGRYRAATPPPIALTIRPSSRAAEAPQIVGGTPVPASTTPTEPLGRDIVFIKDAPGALVPSGAHRWRAAGFWLLQLVPLAIWLVVVVVDRRRRRLGTDVRFARFTRAGRAARDGLAAARTALDAGDRGVFYDRVAGAVHDYLSAKLDLPPGSITAERAGERLRAARIPDRLADELRAFFTTCEQARFAPGAMADGDMRHTLERADAIVTALERERRLRPAAFVVALLLLGLGAGVVVAADGPAGDFFRGNALYADGRYAEAAAAYEQVAAGGVGSAPLWFNLGNAWLKAGDVGRAIAAYERARRLAPRDPDVQANLRFAREEAKVEAVAPPLAARLLVPLAFWATSDELLVLASVAWWVLWLLLAAGRLWPRQQRAATRAAIVAGLVLVIAGSAAAWRISAVDARQAAVVTAGKDVTVRFEPSESGTAHFEAPPGTLLDVLGVRDAWVQVARDDGVRGWIERSALTML
ncbi:MAG TPA: BatD family protein [Candidatus Binatia bacterium]|jgi:tetratricopeptide (TPR) repeat protein|nr:BatD family protein [Candidatus Binatia bacterium]